MNLVVIKWHLAEEKKQTVVVAVDDRYWSICKRKERASLRAFYLQLEIEKVDDTFSKKWLHGTIGEEDARPEGGSYTFLTAQHLQKYFESLPPGGRRHGMQPACLPE